MLHDLLHSRPDPHVVADFCIVGAGAAGIVLAVELASRGRRVLLLEGGGRDVEEASQEPYTSEIAGLPHRGIHNGRFRAMGGTTTRWGGQIHQLDDIDFESRPGVEGSGWPFPKSNLRPFYERALHLEGLGNVTRSDADVWRQIHLDPPRIPGMEPYLTRWCPEPDFAHLHRRTLEHSPDLDLWLHANAVEPMFEADIMRAVRCRTLTGIEAVFRAHRFVFCLGAIESCRFFLQPRPAGIPWNRSGLLGKHFQDHIDCDAAVVEPVNRRLLHQHFHGIFSGGFKYSPKLRLPSVEQAKYGVLNVGATLSFISNANEILAPLKATAKHLLRGRFVQVRPSDVAFAVRNLPTLTRQVARYSLQHRAYTPPDARIVLRVHCEQEPASRSKIMLTSSRDSLGLFRASIDWQISDKELATIRRYVLQASQSLTSLAVIVPDPDLISGNPAFVSRCEDSFHHMGGMRMSESPNGGVVDLNLRLHGIQNAYVCSSAVFPTSGFSNPTHTLLALAVRLSEHLS